VPKTPLAGWAIVALGAALLALTLKTMGSGTRRSRYRRSVWQEQDTLLAATSVGLIAFLITYRVMLPTALLYYPFPRIYAPDFDGGELSGRVEVAGRDHVAVGPGDMSDAVGLVFQDPEAQFVAEIVEDEVAFALENAGLPLQTMRKRVEEVLYALNIDHLRGRRISTLSGGERQRVAIAAVLTLHPQVLVLDEPTSQLDPQSAEEVLDSLVKLNKDLGLTVILSEHRLERVVQHADRILYLEPGGAPLVGPPREVLAEIPLAPPLAQVGKLLGWSPLPLTI